MEELLVVQYTDLNLNSVGGVETHIAQISKALIKRNIPVLLGASHFENLNKKQYSKIILQTHGDRWPDLKFIKHKALNLLNQNNFKWVHIAHGNTLERMKSCNEWKSFSGWKGALRDYSNILLSHAVVGVADHAITELKKYYPYLGKTSVIHNGVNHEIFKPASEISSKPRILFLGRYWDRVKNLRTLLKVSRKIHRENPDFQLWIAPDFDTTEPFIHNLEKLNAIDLNKTLHEVRALVIPSTYEGDPLVAREAMAVGIPILGARIPGILETCKDYPLLFTFDPKNTNELQECIHKILVSNSLTPQPKLRTWDEAAEEYLNFYKTLF